MRLKRRRRGKKALIIITVILLLLISAYGVLAFGTFNFFGHKPNDKDYSGFTVSSLTGNPLVTDIGMLGAHDAFTSQISISSQIDVSGSESLKGFKGYLLKGFGVRHSKTQLSPAAALLKKGVRYFDLRLSYNEKDKEWQTVHNYLDVSFSSVLAQLTTFLKDNPGEFVLLDYQHVFDSRRENNQPDNASIAEIIAKIEESGLFDYTYGALKPLDEVTYNDVTQNGTKGGVIMTIKNNAGDDRFWDYNSCVKSDWFNTDSTENCINKIAAKAAEYEEAGERGRFRVMQAVLTLQMSGTGMFKAIGDWSILDRAKKFNTALVSESAFADWLPNLPIVMVDYSDSPEADFNDKVLEIISEYNKSLA